MALSFENHKTSGLLFCLVVILGTNFWSSWKLGWWTPLMPLLWAIVIQVFLTNSWRDLLRPLFFWCWIPGKVTICYKSQDRGASDRKDSWIHSFFFRFFLVSKIHQSFFSTGSILWKVKVDASLCWNYRGTLTNVRFEEKPRIEKSTDWNHSVRFFGPEICKGIPVQTYLEWQNLLKQAVRTLQQATKPEGLHCCWCYDVWPWHQVIAMIFEG